MWNLISDYSQTIRGSGGGGGGRGGNYGKGVHYSPNVRGRGSGSAGNDYGARGFGAGIRKNVFEFIREKVQPTTTSYGTPSSSGGRYGGASATSHGGSHHSTSESAYDDHRSHSAAPTPQRKVSSQREEDSLKVLKMVKMTGIRHHKKLLYKERNQGIKEKEDCVGMGTPTQGEEEV